MTKRIVFCADGTWDDPDSCTNVYTMFNAVSITPDQVSSYDEGVGSDGTPIQKLLGGAFGDGLFQKIKDGYTKIAHGYNAGDQIFLFGFSRGAYTARSLAGMIAICGLPTVPFDDNLLETAFQAYRNKDQRAALLASLASYQMFDAKITMVDVWDTVGALGIPALEGGVDSSVYGFLDTGLHPDVLNAFQALSIDERRKQFPPTLWTQPPSPGQRVEQVWFAGVHCDVGGRYSETGLSDITLSWMMGKARSLGVEIPDGVWEEFAPMDAEHALSTILESWSPVWGLPQPRIVPAEAGLSNSVPIRCPYDSSYRPQNLNTTNGTPTGSYTIVPVVNPVPA
jgi:uncharacterized protein (DUF2235 family)